MENLGLVSLIISWLTVITGIFTLFEKASDSLKEESKAAISGWLKNIKIKGFRHNWPSMFASTFDSVFTQHHVSWACFLRSSLASVLALIIVTSLVVSFEMSTDLQNRFSEDSFWQVSSVILFGGVILNVIPDYVSLLESRIIINWMGNNSRWFRNLIFLTLDIILTGIIFFLVYACFTLLVLDYSLDKTVTSFISSLTFSGIDSEAGIFIYTTYFTSLWVWLYALSGFFLGFLNKSNLVLEFFKKHLEIEERPLRSMGFVLVVIISLAYLVGCLFLLWV